MLYAGLDLSRRRLDVHVLDEDGRTIEVTAVRPDADALRTLASHVLRHGQEVSAAIESMTGARFVHDTLEFAGWDVAIADAAKVKGIAPLARGTSGDSAPDHPSIALLLTVPGIGPVLAYTIASEVGDIRRFSSPKKLTGYTGLCPLVRQSGNRDVRGPLAKNGPKYLRWALIEAATHAARDALYRERYERTKQRLGRQRGAKVARIDIARKLAESIWHILTKNEPFAPAGPTMLLVA
jgi:transposase